MRQHRPLSPTLEIFDDGANRVRPRVIGIYAVLITANLLAWAGAFASFHGYALLLATALIAYGLGLCLQRLSPWSILVFPALFTAGMSLVDTSDGVLMGEGIDPEEGCRRRGEDLAHSATLWYSG